MANVNNLTPFTSDQSREEAAINGRKGGIASGKARREKKSIQRILNDILNDDANKSPQFSKLAGKLGMEEAATVKEVYAVACLLNSVKNGNIKELERLTRLLGNEDIERESDGFIDALNSKAGEVWNDEETGDIPI